MRKLIERIESAGVESQIQEIVDETVHNAFMKSPREKEVGEWDSWKLELHRFNGNPMEYKIVGSEEGERQGRGRRAERVDVEAILMMLFEINGRDLVCLVSMSSTIDRETPSKDGGEEEGKVSIEKILRAPDPNNVVENLMFGVIRKIRTPDVPYIDWDSQPGGVDYF